MLGSIDLNGLVDDAGFVFRVTPPAPGLAATFEASTFVRSINIGGFSIQDAELTLIQNGSGLMMRVNGGVNAHHQSRTILNQSYLSYPRHRPHLEY